MLQKIIGVVGKKVRNMSNIKINTHRKGTKLSQSGSRSVVSDSLRPHTVYGILQARILEWVAFPFSRGFSQARDRTQVSFIAGGLFTSWATQRCSYFLPHTSVHTWTSALRCLILWRWCEECPDFPNKLGKGVNQNQHRVKGGLSGSA